MQHARNCASASLRFVFCTCVQSTAPRRKGASQGMKRNIHISKGEEDAKKRPSI